MVAAAVLVDEGDEAGCRLTDASAIILEVLASCIYLQQMISPCQAETPISKRSGCVSRSYRSSCR